MFKKFRYLIIKNKLKQFVDNQSNLKHKAKRYEGNIDELNILESKELSFSNTLFKFIDSKRLTDVECYKRANIDRKLFSKIKSDEDYKPSKNTVLAFAVALKLNLNETQELLRSAGFSLSRSFVTDIVIEYFIGKKMWDINLINIALDDYNQHILGSI